MARPEKQGLNSFPHSVELSRSKEIMLLEGLYGLEGYAIFVKILEQVYENGYFMDWNNDVCALFAQRSNTKMNTINNILHTCISNELFDNRLFTKYHILTSAAIQKAYYSSTFKRKRIILVREYLLINNFEECDNVVFINASDLFRDNVIPAMA